MFCWEESFHQRASDSAPPAVQHGQSFHVIPKTLWGERASVVTLMTEPAHSVWGWSFQAWESFLVTGLDFAGILCLFSSDSSESLGSELKLVEKFKEEITVRSYILRDNTYICDVYTDMIKNCLAQNHVYHITCYNMYMYM